MTIEHRLVFELGDLHAIRLECPKCRTVISYRLNQTIRVPDICPSCLERFRDRVAPGATAPIDAFVNALKDLLTSEKPLMKVQLEIDPPAAPIP